MSRAMSDLE